MGKSQHRHVPKYNIGVHFLIAKTYIHANPVREGLVDRPEDYPWSNGPIYAGHPVLHSVTITSYTEIL